MEETIEKRLFDKHFGFIAVTPADLGTDPEGALDRTRSYVGSTEWIKWKSLMRDLRRFPNIACELGGVSELPALHYAVLLKDTPMDVVDKLLEIDPDAIDDPGGDYGLHIRIVKWMSQWAGRTDISPDILRRILQLRPQFVLEGYDKEDGCPLCFFIRDNPNSVQVKTILDTCPQAMPFLLMWHYMEKETIPADLLTYVINHSLNHAGSVGVSNFDTVIESTQNDPEYCLVPQLFLYLTKEKSELLHRYLNIFVKGNQESSGCDYAIDQTSLTSCVVYLLSEWERIAGFHFDRLAAWQKFVRLCGDDELKRSYGKPSSSPLCTALRLRHQWDPVIRDIVYADPGVLGTKNSKDSLLPFMVAATTPRKELDIFGLNYVFGLSYDESTEYDEFNEVNNTYMLLRANPTVICQSPMISLPPKRTDKKRGPSRNDGESGKKRSKP